MGGNGYQELAMFQVFVAEPVILRAEDERDFSGQRRGGNLRRKLARRLTVPAVKPGSTRGSDYKRAIGDGFSYSVITFCPAQDVAAVNGHGPRPKAPRSRLADNGQFGLAHVFHRSRDRADVPGASGSNEHDADVGEHNSTRR